MSPLSVSVSISLLLLVSGFRRSNKWSYIHNGIARNNRNRYTRYIISRKILRNDDQSPSERKLQEADREAKRIVNLLLWEKFRTCVVSKENECTGPALETIISIPQKTTVGFAPSFTLNRKFFGNLIQTRAFKEMLEKDALLVKRNIVNIMKTCDSLSLNQDVLKVFYHREAGQINNIV